MRADLQQVTLAKIKKCFCSTTTFAMAEEKEPSSPPAKFADSGPLSAGDQIFHDSHAMNGPPYERSHQLPKLTVPPDHLWQNRRSRVYVVAISCPPLP